MIPSCLTLSNIRYVPGVKWSNQGKGVAPSPTPRCSSFWKGSLLVALDYGRQLYLLYYHYYYYYCWWWCCWFSSQVVTGGLFRLKFHCYCLRLQECCRILHSSQNQFICLTTVQNYNVSSHFKSSCSILITTSFCYLILLKAISKDFRQVQICFYFALFYHWESHESISSYHQWWVK